MTIVTEKQTERVLIILSPHKLMRSNSALKICDRHTSTSCNHFKAKSFEEI